MTSTFTGVGVAFIDIEPVAIDDFACASSEAFRPSQPNGTAACPIPINGCDRREVSLPESFLLLASVTAQPSCGRWQVTQAVFPDADSAGSKNNSRPRSTSGWLVIGCGGSRRYMDFIASRCDDALVCAAAAVR